MKSAFSSTKSTPLDIKEPIHWPRLCVYRLWQNTVIRFTLAGTTTELLEQWCGPLLHAPVAGLLASTPQVQRQSELSNTNIYN